MITDPAEAGSVRTSESGDGANLLDYDSSGNVNCCNQFGLNVGIAQYDTGWLNGQTDNGHNQWANQTGRHSDSANYGMADGHVKWLRATSVFGPGSVTFNPRA